MRAHLGMGARSRSGWEGKYVAGGQGLGGGQGHEALGSPAEKVSWTCSWITSRATKSCFSLKRPLYSSRPFCSLVANLFRGFSWGHGMGHPPVCECPIHPSNTKAYALAKATESECR